MTLAELVESKREEIVQRWIDSVRPPLAVESLPRALLVDSLPDVIDGLVQALQAHFPTTFGEGLHSTTQDCANVGARHGKQRFILGFNPAELVHEYGLLREVLYSVIEESELEPSIPEMRVVSNYLDLGVANAVGEFVRARDAEWDELAAEHLAFLAHELRNPLTSVHLALQVLARHVPDERKRSVEVMERGLATATELIDSQLVELRLRAGTKPTFEPLEVRSFLQEAIEALQPNAESKGQTLVLEADETIPFEGDKRLLRSVMRNLVGNAIKFSGEGATIVLRGKKLLGRAIFEVEDRCGGLPTGMAEKLFSPYAQFGRDRSGHGLGLAIAKQAAEAHGGMIRVHDFPGKGCNFIVDLPLGQPPTG